jgi:uncharacterized membrane protein (UPF0127 family)
MNTQILNNSQPLKTSLIAKICSSYFCRLRGLMFSKNIEKSQGLLLKMPKESIFMSGIHMVAVNFDLGAVWINTEKIVVDVQLAKKWVSVLTPVKPAKYVLEIHPDRVAEFSLGDKVQFEDDK